MNRRDVIVSGIGAGLALAAGSGTRAEAQPAKPPRPAPRPVPRRPDPGAALLASLQHCLAQGQLCEAHCATQLAAGVKDFARCAAAIADLLAIGWATQGLVARKSAAAKKLVEVCMAACRECSAACLEHKPHWAHGMHLECKACMEACDACQQSCSAYLRAA